MSDVQARVRGMLDEAGLPEAASAELMRLLAGLEERYVDGSVPEPGPELAALLAGATSGPGPGAGKGTRGRRAAAAGVLALGVVVSTGWAAAANELPAPAQRWVARFSQRYLPFELPYPDAGVRGGGAAPWSGDTSRTRSPDGHDSRPSPPDRDDGRSAAQGPARETPRSVQADEPAGDSRVAETDRYAREGSEREQREEHASEPREAVEAREETPERSDAEDRSGTGDAASGTSDSERAESDGSQSTADMDGGGEHGSSSRDGVEDHDDE